MKNNSPIILTLLLLLMTIGNYIRINQDNSLRAVEFLSILAIGALMGVLIVFIARRLRNSKDKKQ